MCLLSVSKAPDVNGGVWRWHNDCGAISIRDIFALDRFGIWKLRFDRDGPLERMAESIFDSENVDCEVTYMIFKSTLKFSNEVQYFKGTINFRD